MREIYKMNITSEMLEEEMNADTIEEYLTVLEAVAKSLKDMTENLVNNVDLIASGESDEDIAILKTTIGVFLKGIFEDNTPDLGEVSEEFLTLEREYKEKLKEIEEEDETEQEDYKKLH